MIYVYKIINCHLDSLLSLNPSIIHTYEYHSLSQWPRTPQEDAALPARDMKAHPAVRLRSSMTVRLCLFLRAKFASLTYLSRGLHNVSCGQEYRERHIVPDRCHGSPIYQRPADC